jgi:hypothetical protein
MSRQPWKQRRREYLEAAGKPIDDDLLRPGERGRASSHATAPPRLILIAPRKTHFSNRSEGRL